MRKFHVIVFITVLILGCREDAVQFTLDQSTADIIVNSTPRKAQIYLNNSFTGKFTPDTLKYLEAGSYLLTLKLDGYKDSSTTILIEPENNQSLFISLKLL